MLQRIFTQHYPQMSSKQENPFKQKCNQVKLTCKVCNRVHLCSKISRLHKVQNSYCLIQRRCLPSSNYHILTRRETLITWIVVLTQLITYKLIKTIYLTNRLVEIIHTSELMYLVNNKRIIYLQATLSLTLMIAITHSTNKNHISIHIMLLLYLFKVV